MTSLAQNRLHRALVRTWCSASSAFRECSSSPRFHEEWDAAPFAYFYTDATDVFWHNLEQYQGQGAKLHTRIGSHNYPKHRAGAIRIHNDRIRKDWGDYNEGRSGQAERLQKLQTRLEQDMLDNAFVDRTQEVLSALQRGSHTSSSMASQWMAAAQGAATFLQDCIIFRGENLERLAACRDVAWLPSVNTIKSYHGLLDTSLAPLNTPLPPTPGCWALYLSLVTPSNATACAAFRLQHALMRTAFTKGKRVSVRARPQVSQVTQSIGGVLVAAANATALQLRVAVHARGAAQGKLLRARHYETPSSSSPQTLLPLDPAVREAAPLLAQLKQPGPLDLHDAGKENVKVRVMREMQQGALSANNGTTAAVGSVLMQLLMMQLNARSLHPLFRQPIPWHFVSPAPAGGQRRVDYEFESSQFPVEGLAEYSTIVETIKPIYGPCLTAPLPWVAPNRGCYRLCHEDHSFGVDVMRTKNPLQHKMLMQKHGSALAGRVGGPQLMQDALQEHAELESAGSVETSKKQDVGLWPVFEALNVLGSQGWSINSNVLRVVQAVDETQEAIADIPVREPPPPPRHTSPHFHASVQYFLTEVQGARRQVSGPMLVAFQPLNRRDVQRESKRIAAAAREYFNVMSQRGMFKMQLQAALAHELYDTIYFPHNIDFRGRAYPMPPHLNHMGADICRGLLQFSEARPLGEGGFRWLLIHLANVFGVVDKQSFDRRMLWSLENLSSIVDSADNPLSGRRWWVDAENPWTALATCTDIAAALRSGDVSKYCSKLPVHQDGSCNGLQHYAALGRDASGAEAVNLVDSSEPQDVYGVVADRFATLVADEAASSTDSHQAQYARSLLGHTDRKLVKQTVMTTVYGVTMRGARDQVANRLIERGWPRDSRTSAVAQYAAGLILEALEGLFSSAKIMTWLRQSARTVAKKTQQTVQWTTPLGLPVLQPYFVEEKATSLMQPLPPRPSGHDAIAQPAKQSSAFPPNYVHSLDATHMMMTARECHARGLAFAGVHDSFWTHAAHVDICRDVIREQFVEMYREPLLERLKEHLEESAAAPPQDARRVADVAASRREAQEQQGGSSSGDGEPVEIAPVPNPGMFDLDKVRQSTYFFN